MPIKVGERRWRAAKELGLGAIPATVEDLTDEEAQARRVLENTQRKVMWRSALCPHSGQGAQYCSAGAIQPIHIMQPWPGP
jgi:hypothetical protein